MAKTHKEKTLTAEEFREEARNRFKELYAQKLKRKFR